jgi:cytochrome c-type biogenesis protein CcmH/NrfG
MSEVGKRLTEEAGTLARDTDDLRAAAESLLGLAGGDRQALQEAQGRWAELLHEDPENSDALGALVLLGTALRLQQEQSAQGS